MSDEQANAFHTASICNLPATKKKKQKRETYFRFWIACQGSYGATNPAKKYRPQHSLHKAADIL